MTREQFIELVKGEQDALRHYLLALCCGDLATADDIAQETLVKAYLSLLSYANKGKFRSWLFAIAHNTFLNHRKATRTYESLEEAKMVIDKQEAVTLYYLTGYSVEERNRNNLQQHRRRRQETTLPRPGQTQITTQTMTPDKDIQNLFDSVKMPFTDNDAFLDTLNQRLDKVEFVKSTQNAQIRRYKISVICSLVAGLIAGSVSTVLSRILPVTIFQKVYATLAALPLLEAGNTPSVLKYGIPLLIGTAVFLIVLNMQEIHEIRSSGMQQQTSIRPTSDHR